MSWLSLKDIADLCGGHLLGDDTGVDSVSIDTRTLKSGQLYIALQGEHYDGHDFVNGGQADTAAGFLVQSHMMTSRPQIIVDDTQRALCRLAKTWRERLTLPVFALTGSNGKTTVKEMMASILSIDSNVWSTRGNLNNHIGVPLTVLAIRPHHDYAIVEMGANHPGEIGGLTDIVCPDVALITNAGPAHLEGFGSLEGVAHAKGEIFNGLDQQGVAIINADDAFADYWYGCIGDRRRIRFGMEHPAEVRGAWDNTDRLLIESPSDAIEISLPMPGRHNALNALAAAAGATAFNIGLEQIKQGLERMQPVSGRLVTQPGVSGSQLLDDTYNANPASLRAGLEVLVASPGEHWLVLGDMGELGAEAGTWHRAAGELARTLGVKRLFTLGELSQEAVDAFGSGAVHYSTSESLLHELRMKLSPGVRILVKGSRAMRMENIVASLLTQNQISKLEGLTGHAA